MHRAAHADRMGRPHLLRSSTSLLPTRGESTVTMMAPYPAFSAPAHNTKEFRVTAIYTPQWPTSIVSANQQSHSMHVSTLLPAIVQHSFCNARTQQIMLNLLRMREAVKPLSRWTYSWNMRRELPSLAAATSSKLVVPIVDTIYNTDNNTDAQFRDCLPSDKPGVCKLVG